MISDYEWDEKGNLKAGIVERHSADKEDVYRKPSLDKPTAFRYTGESTFSGLRSHVHPVETIWSRDEHARQFNYVYIRFVKT
jgi:hypothetical protein